MEKKKILIAGVLVLGVAGYIYMAKKKKEKESILSMTSGTSSPSVVEKNNYPVSLSGDNQGMVWIVIDGKKYSVGSTQALIDYGIEPSNYPYTSLSSQQLDLIPNGGLIGEKGLITKF